MSKDNTKAIRIDDNELLLIHEYKLKYNIKTDSDAIRKLIKDGLSFNHINNKSIVYYLKAIINDESNLNAKTLQNYSYYQDLANYIIMSLNNLKDLNAFIQQYFYDSQTDTINFNYKSFLTKCLDQHNDTFINDLETILLNQYMTITTNNQLLYSTKAIQLYKLINNAKVGSNISDLGQINHINDAVDLLIDCSYTLNTDNLSQIKTYVYDFDLFNELYCEMINKIAYVKHKNVNDYDLYQKIKELYVELNKSYLSIDKLNNLY